MEQVVLGMSGGVDSSVAALLLQKKGYKVYGYFMNCGVNKKKILPSAINWKEDERIVRKVCKKLGIDLHMADCELGYEKKIIGPMIKDYERGLTPNPDVLCNDIGKFPNMLKVADKIGAEFIATGHYAISKKGKLFRGKDREKDQSYFICTLDEKILKRCIFPLGELKKGEVRKIAKRNGFSNYDKRSSRGICYLGKIDVKKFLRGRIKEKEGRVVDVDRRKVGKHIGQMFFTIGERVRDSKGIEIDDSFRREVGNKRLFVAKKVGNKLVVAEEGSKILKEKKIGLIKFRLVDRGEKVSGKKFKGRIRHLGELHAGRLKKERGRWTFVFDRGVGGLAGGQMLVLYDGERVVGSGEMRVR